MLLGWGQQMERCVGEAIRRLEMGVIDRVGAWRICCEAKVELNKFSAGGLGGGVRRVACAVEGERRGAGVSRYDNDTTKTLPSEVHSCPCLRGTWIVRSCRCV